MKSAKRKIFAKQIALNALGVLIFILSVVGVLYKEAFCPGFLLLLIFQMIMTYFRATKIHDFCLFSARMMLGLLFVFSGFVKGVDPVGTQYKMEDYFIAFGTDWALPYALLLSYLMNMLEFSVGVFLVFKIRFRRVLFVVGAMMLFFTLTTLNDAIYNPVPDCGCFGDAVKLSNWQTFYKNLVLDFLWLVLWFNRKRVKTSLSVKVQTIFAGLLMFIVLLLEQYNVRHLPWIDFRDWKIGKDMILRNPQPVRYYLTYKNKITGETKEYLSPDYPYNDSAWLAQWEYVDKRVEDPNVRLHDVMITDQNGDDITDMIINATDTTLFIAMPEINEQAAEVFRALVPEVRNVAGSVRVVLLSADAEEKIEDLLQGDTSGIEYYYADDIALKAMVRSNPGFVLLRQGIVKGKWHYHDFSAGEVQKAVAAP